MKKRIISILLALVLCVGLLPTLALGAEIVASGTCGALGYHLPWTLDSNGTLTISGNGRMGDYFNGKYDGLNLWTPYKTNIKQVIIQEGVTNIGENAFSGCTNLIEVTLPNGLTDIGESAFSNCSSLVSINIPNGVTSISYYAFQNCTALKSIVIPDSVTVLRGWLFYNCTSLMSVTLPKNVLDSDSNFGEFMFYNCSNLTTVTLPNNIVRISEHAFNQCSSLRSIVIPSGVTEIGRYAFFNCNLLSDVYFDGTEEQWGKVFIGEENYMLLVATKHFAPVAVSSVTLNTNKRELIDGSTVTLTATVLPADATDKTVTWSSSDPAVATVDNGTVTAVGVGTATITAKAGDVTATCTVTVEPKPTSGVILDQSLLSLDVGATATLTATVLPEDATDKTVTWTSSDPAVATVENGVITAVAAGSATITAAAGGQSATCAVTVTASADPTPVDPTPVDPTPVDPTPVDPTPVDPTPQPHNPFTDVPLGEWFTDAVLWAVEHGITNGTSDTTFSPGKGCTRGQVATFLWRAFGSIAPKITVNPFDDVKDGEYYYNPVLWAVENGVTNGASKDAFGPKNTCTRGQVVTFLWRAAGSPEPKSKTNPFTDVKTTDYFYKAVLWAVENGITNGTSDTTFSPGNTCTRAHVVTFLYRAMT